MIINALCRYYNILVNDAKTEIPSYGFSYAQVGYALNISESGELLDVISLKTTDTKRKKPIPKRMIVPEQANRSSNICASFMCDNSKYALGLDRTNIKKAQEKFVAFKELHYSILKSANGVVAKAILNYLNLWNVNKANQHRAIKENLDDITDGSYLVFKIDGQAGFAHEDIEIRTLWEKQVKNNQQGQMGQCLITGDKTRIAQLHPKIKKVKNAQSSGASIVSFNAPAYISYGRIQGYNAPIGQYSSFAYTTVLNYMLSSSKQKLQIGDATTVFWAETAKEIYIDLAEALFNPLPSTKKQGKDASIIRDIKTERIVKDVLYNAKMGIKIRKLDGAINDKTKFYILGLSPNASRISIRFFHFDNFGGFVSKMAQHYCDLEIIKEFSDQPSNIPIWMILNETVSAKAKNKETIPLLAGSVMRAVISGTRYPTVLYNAIMQRIRADIDDKEKNIRRINYIRTAIIKAYLTRQARFQTHSTYKEVLTVSLNEQSTNTAYLLGRLFAVLEKAQQDANPSINATIKDRYFTSACATPASVFPILLKLGQHHISKSDFGYVSDKRIESIIANLTKFPSHLNLEDQGVFVLGYYHQRIALFQKSNKKEEGGC